MRRPHFDRRSVDFVVTGHSGSAMAALLRAIERLSFSPATHCDDERETRNNRLRAGAKLANLPASNLAVNFYGGRPAC